MRVALLHGYSAENAGDGLLVIESISLIRQALGPDTEIDAFVSHPASFEEQAALHNFNLIATIPRSTDACLRYLGALLKLRRYNLIVGVGGGYLRMGTAIEGFKTSAVHLPQLIGAAVCHRPSIYMPQSVGPARGPGNMLLSVLIRRIDSFFVRDDRSFSSFKYSGVKRSTDLAIATSTTTASTYGVVDSVPILSVRHVHGDIPTPVTVLAERLGTFDGYVQSATHGNDDREAMASLRPRRVVSRAELMDASTRPKRVVVAVRLHAALMALRAGHFVIHLAYERKGFGAFYDLGLGRFVHNVNRFEPAAIAKQVRLLSSDVDEQELYLAALRGAAARGLAEKARLISTIRELGLPNAD